MVLCQPFPCQSKTVFSFKSFYAHMRVTGDLVHCALLQLCVLLTKSTPNVHKQMWNIIIANKGALFKDTVINLCIPSVPYIIPSVSAAYSDFLGIITSWLLKRHSNPIIAL